MHKKTFAFRNLSLKIAKDTGILFMKKKSFIIFSVIAALFILQFGVKPLLYKREALRTLKTIFGFWKEGLTLEVLYYFQDSNNSLPIYNLSSFKIKSQKINKKEAIKSYVFTARLDFPQNNIVPSGEDWEIVLSDLPDGWKITSIDILKN